MAQHPRINSSEVEPPCIRCIAEDDEPLVFDKESAWFKAVVQRILKWYGFTNLKLEKTEFDTWYRSIVEHVTTNQKDLTACINQIIKDHNDLDEIEIPLHNLYFGQSVPHNSPKIATLRGQLKSRTTSLQKAIIDQSQLSLLTDDDDDGDDDLESIRDYDWWSPMNLPFSYQIFTQHLRWINSTKKFLPPSLNYDICRLRYTEYMSQVLKNNHKFLLVVLTAYDCNVEEYPLRVIQLLQIRKLFRHSSKYRSPMKGAVTLYSDIKVRKYSDMDMEEEVIDTAPIADPSRQSSEKLVAKIVPEILDHTPLPSESKSEKEFEDNDKDKVSGENFSMTFQQGPLNLEESQRTKLGISISCPTPTSGAESADISPVPVIILEKPQLAPDFSILSSSCFKKPEVTHDLTSTSEITFENPEALSDSSSIVAKIDKPLAIVEDNFSVDLANPRPNTPEVDPNDNFQEVQNQIPPLLLLEISSGSGSSATSVNDMEEETDTDKDSVCSSTEPRIPFFEIPIDDWEIICERTIATENTGEMVVDDSSLHPSLTEDDYRMCFDRFVNHAETYKDFLLHSMITPTYSTSNKVPEEVIRIIMSTAKYSLGATNTDNSPQHEMDFSTSEYEISQDGFVTSPSPPSGFSEENEDDGENVPAI